MKLKPLRDRIIVERIEEEEKEVGGVLIPDTAKEKPQKGKVIAVGPGRRTEKGDLIPVAVKEGDIIIFRKYAGNEVTVDDKEYLIIDEDDVLAVVEE